ncbi:unnamed protein product [Adineta steineri]|uniref:Neuralized-like protein 2 n=1 Tax=Adineta steineri TaxID=433720 RepID=A0A815MIG5_9BILA|nr:unnamed protein product [Adineta steineri]
MRFHELHGKNIQFDEQRLAATRFNSFTHAMIFSERPLYPGELFLVEIEDITDSWTGNIKIGLTCLSPNEILSQCTQEILYDDIFHITIPSRPVTQYTCTCGLYRPLFNFGSPDDYIHTPFDSIRRQSIEPVQKSNDSSTSTCPTNIGSRIGIIYALKQQSIHMHCILNGFDYGPFTVLNIGSSTTENNEIILPSKKHQATYMKSKKSINKYTKFWAFVDVYGATKKVRIIQLYGPSPLKHLCRLKILSNLKSNDLIDTIFLNSRLQSYLKFYIA